MKRYSEFATKRQHMIGDKIKIEKILGKEIAILSYRISPSIVKEDTNCLAMQIEVANEKRIIFTSSTILMEEIEKYKDNLPFLTTIEKIDRFYIFA